MRILALETSGDTSSVALLDDGQVSAENSFASRRTICQQLIGQIQATVGTEQLRSANLDGVAVSQGPASFTGLRVGVTTAKAIAYCCQIPVVGISTPLAWAAEASAQAGSLVIVLQPARRDRLYLTPFEQTKAPWPRQIDQTSVVRFTDVASACPVADSTRLVITGNALLSASELSEHLPDGAELACVTTDSPQASTIARIGADKIEQVSLDSHFTLRPTYVLVSQAERSRGVNLGL